MEINNCRKTFPNFYIRVMAFNSDAQVESPSMSFIVNRPVSEPGFRLRREERDGRSMGYTIESYASDRPEGERYM